MVADAAGRFQFLRPDGMPLPAVPPAAQWQGAGAPLAPTVARLAADGITIGPHTTTPEWYGESLNVTAALDVLVGTAGSGTSGCRGARRRSLRDPRPGGAAQRG